MRTHFLMLTKKTLGKLFAITITVSLLLAIASMILLEAQPQLEDKLVLIGPVYTQEAEAVMRGFKEYVKREFGKDIEVQYLKPGGWPVCVDKVRAWGGHPEADVFFGGGPPAYEVMKKEGLLEKYIPKTAGNLPEKAFGTYIKDSEGYWYAFSLWFVSNIYNENVLKALNLPPPKTWDDLLKKEYRGYIVHTIPYASGTMHETVEILIQSRGWDEAWAYLRRLAVNLARFSTSSTDTLMIVERGEAPIGVAQPQMNAMMAQADGYPVKAVVPEVTMLTAEGVALLKNAPHPNLAKLFMDWILSEEGQKYVLQGGYFPAMKDFRFSKYEKEIPMAKYAKAALGVDNFYEISGVTALDYNLTLASERWDQVNTYYEQEIYRKWEELKSTWTLIEEVEEEINVAKAKGVDTTKAVGKINEAKALFGKGQLAEARLAATEARNLLVTSPTAPAQPTAPPTTPPYEIYATIIIIILAVIIAAFLYYKTKKK